MLKSEIDKIERVYKEIMINNTTLNFYETECMSDLYKIVLRLKKLNGMEQTINWD